MSEDYYGDGRPCSAEEAYEKAIRAGYDMSVGPYEDSRDYIDDEWWDHWEIFNDQSNPRNWQEDFSHENGNYCQRCFSCGELFLGHKRRISCKTCCDKEPKEPFYGDDY